MRGRSSCPTRYFHGVGVKIVHLLIAAALALTFTACGKQRETKEAAVKPPPKAAPAPAEPVKTYAYANWSDWQLDCSKRFADPNLPCAAVRKRVCQVEGTQEGVACENCGGQCREEIIEEKARPLHLYAAWSEWRNGCQPCDAEPRPCKTERTRMCLDRLTGKSTDCEFCGGNCKQQEDRMSDCSPECKWTQVHAYSDSNCTVKIRGDTFAGQWGPQTNSPFNAGCSTTQWNEKCVNFGKNYYKWEPCTPGCTPPMKR